jgi:hypothetical protein
MYVVVKNNKEVKVFQESEKVDEYIRKEDGNYYIVSIYPALMVVEQYQVYEKKAYRINAINM